MRATPQDIYRLGGNENRGGFKPKLTPFWIGYEVVVSLLMLICMISLYVYDFNLTPKAPFQISAAPYDADAFATARYFMPRRRVVRCATCSPVCSCVGHQHGGAFMVAMAPGHLC